MHLQLVLPPEFNRPSLPSCSLTSLLEVPEASALKRKKKYYVGFFWAMLAEWGSCCWQSCTSLIPSCRSGAEKSREAWGEAVCWSGLFMNMNYVFLGAPWLVRKSGCGADSQWKRPSPCHIRCDWADLGQSSGEMSLLLIPSSFWEESHCFDSAHFCRHCGGLVKGPFPIRARVRAQG